MPPFLRKEKGGIFFIWHVNPLATHKSATRIKNNIEKSLAFSKNVVPLQSKRR
jgi:hypothetical protein